MLQTKFMLLAIVVLAVVNSTAAIIGGKSAVPGQFPFFVLLETFKSPSAMVFILLWNSIFKQTEIHRLMSFLANNSPKLRGCSSFE